MYNKIDTGVPMSKHERHGNDPSVTIFSNIIYAHATCYVEALDRVLPLSPSVNPDSA